MAKRERPYPVKMSICISVATRENLRRESERADISVATIARRAIERGLPMIAESRRKASRKKTGPAPAKASKRPRSAKS